MARAKNEHDAETAGRAPAPTVAAVKHAIDVLRVIAGGGSPLGISQIARNVGLHKSTVSRLVATLEAEHLVERAPGSDRVRLGLGLAALAASVLPGLGLSQASRPRLAALAELSGETVNLGVWTGQEAISVDQAVGTSAITHYAAPGQSNPAHSTATGKLLLAFAPADEIDAVLSAPLTAHTPHTTTDPETLRNQLLPIRRDGWAINIGEFAEDVGAVAAAVRDHSGTTVAAITITVPMYRFGEQRRGELLAMVRETAAAVSAQLGWHGRPDR